MFYRRSVLEAKREMIKRYEDQAYHKTLAMVRIGKMVGDFEGANLFQEIANLLKKSGYDKYPPRDCNWQ